MITKAKIFTKMINHRAKLFKIILSAKEKIKIHHKAKLSKIILFSKDKIKMKLTIMIKLPLILDLSAQKTYFNLVIKTKLSQSLIKKLIIKMLKIRLFHRILITKDR